MPLLKPPTLAQPVDTQTLKPSLANPEGADKAGQAWVANWIKGRQAQLQENMSDPDIKKNMKGIQDNVYFNSQPKWDMINRSAPQLTVEDETKAQLTRMSDPSTGLDLAMNKGELAYYDPTNKQIKYNKSFYTGFDGTPNNRVSTLAHERTHASEAVPQYAKIYGLQKQYGIKNGSHYLQDPGETYSRLNELRMDMGLKPGDTVTPDMMFKNADKIVKHDFGKYDPKYTLDLLNKVAYAKVPTPGIPTVTPGTPTAQNGGLLVHVSATVPKTIPSKTKKTIGGTLSAYELKNRRKEELNPNYSHG